MYPAGQAAFPRSCRLNRAEDYRRVFNSNYRVTDGCLTILIGNQPTTQTRIGFAVAKKQVKRAVDRNRIKRQVRESFRHQRDRLPNRDLVVMVRSSILKLTHAEIFDRLDRLWQAVNQKCVNS